MLFLLLFFVIGCFFLTGMACSEPKTLVNHINFLLVESSRIIIIRCHNYFFFFFLFFLFFFVFVCLFIRYSWNHKTSYLPL